MIYRPLTLLLVLTLIWTLSLRPVRLKAGDFHLLRNNFDQSIILYAKIVRKEKFEIESGIGPLSTVMSYENDLSKLRVAIASKAETTLYAVSKIVGIQDLGSSFIQERFPSQEIGSSVKYGSTKLQLAKNKLSELSNLNNYFADISPNSTRPNIVDFISSKHHFLNGAIDEIEGNFFAADASYEKAAILSDKDYRAYIRARQKNILPKAADQYFDLTSGIKLIGYPNVKIDSMAPLIIANVSPGIDNYLAYEKVPVKYLKAKFPQTILRIQGEVVGNNRKSCIIPRMVFWGAEAFEGINELKGYIDETGNTYMVDGKFDISFSFVTPPQTLAVTPRVSFVASCFQENQKVILNAIGWY